MNERFLRETECDIVLMQIVELIEAISMIWARFNEYGPIRKLVYTFVANYYLVGINSDYPQG